MIKIYNTKYIHNNTVIYNKETRKRYKRNSIVSINNTEYNIDSVVINGNTQRVFVRIPDRDIDWL